MAKPPLKSPNKALIVSSKSSAIFAFSSVIPMKINKGTAISVSFVMVPYRRLGSAFKYPASKLPVIRPMPANISATPPSVKATGNPAIRSKITEKNNNTLSIIFSV